MKLKVVRLMTFAFVLIILSGRAVADDRGTSLSPDQEQAVKMLEMLKSNAPAVRELLASFKTREGGIFCPSYLSLPEARAAVNARDQSWFLKTGCFSAQGAMRVELIDAPLGTNATWRGRIYPPGSAEGVNMYFDQYHVVATALAANHGIYREFPTPDAAQKWAAQNGLANLPHAVAQPPGAGRTFYLLQIGPAAYATLDIACHYQEKCQIIGKLPR
jgi:hypothetical protein